MSANVLYDFHIMPRWGAYIGGGVGGAGINRESYANFGASEFRRVGVPVAGDRRHQYAAPYNLDLYAEYRYRGADVSNTYEFIRGSVASGNDVRQNAVLVGIRYYPFAVMYVPPPPPPPPPRRHLRLRPRRR